MLQSAELPVSAQETSSSEMDEQTLLYQRILVCRRTLHVLKKRLLRRRCAIGSIRRELSFAYLNKLMQNRLSPTILINTRARGTNSGCRI